MSINFFDQLDEAKAQTEVKAFQKINTNDKKELLAWLKSVVTALHRQAEPRTSQQKHNLRLYRGLSHRRRDLDRSRIYRGRRLNKLQKLVVPIIHDLTETRVSQMTRIKPSVDVLPANNEQEDRHSAKVVELIIKHLWYINNIDYIVQKLHREARIFGESYLWLEWDPNKGDLHPLYVKARDLGLKEIELPDGTKLNLDKDAPLKTGDICYKNELPWRVLMQRKPEFTQVEYVFRAKLIPTDQLQEDHPKKDIKPTEDLRLFDVDSMRDKLLEDHTLVWEFWHKKTPQVPKGFHAEFTMEDILIQEDHPYNFGELPFIRLTDLDVPHALNGASKYQLVEPMLNMYNNVNTLIAKNIWLTAHAKWMMPRNAAKIEQLGNDNTVVQYQGPIPPSLVQVQPNPPEVYKYKDDLKVDAQLIYGSHGISRGAIPPGITAASALTFLNELESQRATTEISKHSFTLVDIAKKTISIIGDKYEPDDGRLVRIIGQHNQFSIKHYDTAHLHKAYDIRFSVGTGLPDTKAGKRQIILDMMERIPKAFSGEEWEEKLEVGNVEKALDGITAAVKAADSENEDMAAGRPVVGPEEWEDHFIHLQSHYRFVQSRFFKEDLNPEYRKTIKDHIFWTEEAALDKARNNPEFEAKLASLTLFPMFHHQNYVPPRSMEQQAAVVQGQANKEGAVPTDVQIPAQEAVEPKR